MEKWVYGGEGLGRLEGRVVLVPFVLPGESVRVRVERERPDMLRARLLEVTAPAGQRVDPPCPYFARCGGCHYQHAPYEFQLEQKRTVLREVLRRVGKLEAPEKISIVSGPPWEYRNRTQFHLTEGRIGYHEAGSHRLCPVERCPISSPRINEALSALRRMIRQPRFPRFLRSLELFTNETEVQINVLQTAERRVARSFFEWCANTIPGAGVSALEYRTGAHTFRVSHQSFFQVNRFLVDQLVETAVGGAEGETAIDLYAGVGLFSLPLARRFARVTAVESSRHAVADLEFNSARAEARIDARHAAAEAFLESLEASPDFLIADPPRTGLGKAVVHRLLRVRPRSLTVVSCDPSTLARDLGALLAGGYRLAGMTMIDLFPQTYHIETVARLDCP